MSPPIQSIKISRKVAVIGAGAAGLIAARELRREGHEVVVFERNNKIGGIWVYDSNVESDPLSRDPSRTLVHTSLYDSLRTNHPREVMGYRDYPFMTKQGKHRDSRRFPGHEEVLRYLEDFVSDFRLSELIRFETEVVRVGLVEDGKWGVSYRRRKRDGIVDDGEDEVYDSVVVCNGHYTEPNVADIPGIKLWPGKQIHSHNYRVPDPFSNQVVVVIGSSASAYDISRDIAKVAKEVHVTSRSINNGSPSKEFGYDNMWLHSMVKSLPDGDELEGAHEDGRVVFQDGSSVVVDIILHCTGYKFHFPFLEVGDMVTVDENRVGPLYKHVFPPGLAPWLSFIGLARKNIPFPLCELQSKWVAVVLSGRISLPSQEVMMLDVETFYSKLESAGVPKRHTHNSAEYQFEYCDWLAAECGFRPTEEWRKQMHRANKKNRVARPETYRDEWEDQYLVLQAQEEFLTYTCPTGDG